MVPSPQNPIFRFHVCLHAMPEEAAAGPPVQLGGRSVPSLVVSPAATGSPLPLSFEEVVERLSSLERMFVEPDGSLLWVSPQGPGDWQVDGNLYDRDGHLLYVELKGHCPEAAFDQLLQACAPVEQPWLFQLVREAVFVDEATFRRWARMP